MKKMSKLSFLMLFATPSFLWAAGLNQKGEIQRRQDVILSSLSKHVKVTLPPALTQAVDTTKSSEEAAQKLMDGLVSTCLVDTCGQPKSNWNAYNMMDPRKTESVNFKNEWEQVLTPSIAADMQDELDFQKELSAQLTEGLAKTSLSETQTRAMKSFLFFKNMASEAVTIAPEFIKMDPFTMAIKLDETLLANTLKSLPADAGQAITLTIKQYIFPLYKTISFVQFESPLTARLHVMYPEMDRKKALAYDAKNLIEAYGEIRKNYGEAAAAYLIGMSKNEVDLIKAAAAGKILADGDADTYAEIAGNIDLYAFAVRPDALDLFSKMNSNFDSVVDNAKKNYAIFVQKTLEAYSFEDSIAEVSAICRPRLAMRTALDASDFRRERAQRMIKEIREAAKTVIKNYVIDGDNQKAVAAQIDQASFIFPDRGDAVLEKYKARLKAHRDFIAEERAFLKSGGDEVASFLMVTSLVQMQKIGDGDSIFSEKAKYLCGKIDIGSFSDFSVPPFGQINISWASLAFQEYTVGVMAHELGHVVSNKIRMLPSTSDAMNFYESLSCVASRNPFVGKPVQLSKFDNTTWSEEDWADHFAAQVMTEMGRNKSQWVESAKNMACGMIMNDDKAYLLNSMAPGIGDPHSSGLLRVFMLGGDLGTLPNSCQSILKPNTCL